MEMGIGDYSQRYGLECSVEKGTLRSMGTAKPNYNKKTAKKSPTNPSFLYPLSSHLLLFFVFNPNLFRGVRIRVQLEWEQWKREFLLKTMRTK